MTPPRTEHTTAIARMFASSRAVGFIGESIAVRLLESTDPAVHAAMLDALTRHGALKEQWRYDPKRRKRLVTPWEMGQ